MSLDGKGEGEGWVLMSRTLTANIRQRRGSLVDIRVPLFVDEKTEVPEGKDSKLSNGVPSELAPYGTRRWKLS